VVLGVAAILKKASANKAGNTLITVIMVSALLYKAGRKIRALLYSSPELAIMALINFYLLRSVVHDLLLGHAHIVYLDIIQRSDECTSVE